MNTRSNCRSLLLGAFSLFILTGAAHAVDVTVTVRSEYGATPITTADIPQDTAVAPLAGEHTFPSGTEVTFSAPRYVYLDRYRNEIPSEAGAYYRVRPVRATVPGGNANLVDSADATRIQFTETLQGDITVQWAWELDNAVFIATDGEFIDELDPQPGDTAVGSETAGATRYWVQDQTSVNASIESAITDDLPEGVRFRPTGFLTEGGNVEGADHSMIFSGGGERIVGP